MSKIGKKIIEIPENVKVNISGNLIKIKGPLGELEFSYRSQIRVEKKLKFIKVSPQKLTKYSRSLFGLTRTLIFNMVEGVTKGFQKQLELSGTGFRAQVSDNKLTLLLGFSHPVEYLIPAGIDIKVEKNRLTISGIDKQKVGQTAAEIRKFKVPDPYKAKGIKYVDEIIKTKPGKAVAKTLAEEK